MSSNTINLSEGIEQFNLVFTDRGEAVTIAFNPSDTDILMRIEKSRENIESALAEIPKDETDSAKVVMRAGDIIRKEIDYIFGSKISDKVFMYCSPLSLNASGVTFAERFLAAVTPHIQSRISDANRASAERVAKHTAKYARKSDAGKADK